METTIFEKAEAIANKLEELDISIIYYPEWVLRRATPEQINFFYSKMFGAEKPL